MTDRTDIITNPGTGAIKRSDNPVIVTSPADEIIETDFNAPKRIGLWVAFLVFGVFGLWAAFARLDSAAVAAGTVTVKSYKKTLQHLEGGIVQDIRVQNGAAVKTGDILLVIDNTQSLAELGIIVAQRRALLALEARLVAERDNLAAVKYPADLDPDDDIDKVEINAQNQVFAARKMTNEGEIAVLEQRVSQLQSRIEGFKAMRESKEILAASFEEELEDIRALLDEGFADKLRLRDLERSFAATRGEAAELTANIAATEIQMGETKLEILQQKNRFQSEVVKELSEVQTKLQDAQERYTALSDVVDRTEIRATDNGVVTNLQVHTIGGIIPPGQVIAEIVPQSDQMVVEAQVSPLDRDRISEGQEATVRMPAFNTRVTPTLYGTVTGISADRITDQQANTAYYLARIEINPESLADLEDQALVPGMPAEVFITTGSRTFLEILFKSLSDSVSRSFRED